MDCSLPVSAAVVNSYTLPPVLYAKARSLAHVRLAFALGEFIYCSFALWLVLHWKLAVRFQRWALRCSSNSRLQAIVFGPLLIATLALLYVPLEAAAHFAARAYGISVQGWLSWSQDWAKTLMLEIVLGSVLIWLFYFILRRSARRWWLFAWLAALPLVGFAVFAEPILIEPMFNRFAPLEQKNPQLVAELERVAQRAGVYIPPDRMFWMHASDKTPGMNAYVAGIGSSKRVVIWDTTLSKEPTPEIVAVFGHELGHYVLGHIWKGTLAFVVLLLAGLYLEFLLVPRIIARWGAGWGIARIDEWASLPAILLVLLVLAFAADPLSNGFSRYVEHQADVYGLEVTHGVLPNVGQATAASFQLEGETSLADPAPSPLDVFWFYDHPPIPDRIRFCLSYDPWQPGRSPRFVK